MKINNTLLIRSERNTASIIFAPICSNCKTIIFNETVDVVEDPDLLHQDFRRIRGKDITPERCPKCGVIFDKIMISTKLPFEKNQYEESDIYDLHLP